MPTWFGGDAPASAVFVISQVLCDYAGEGRAANVWIADYVLASRSPATSALCKALFPALASRLPAEIVPQPARQAVTTATKAAVGD